MIFLSATLKGKKKTKQINSKRNYYTKGKKEISQPTKIKTECSTFKNSQNQTNKRYGS